MSDPTGETPAGAQAVRTGIRLAQTSADVASHLELSGHEGAPHRTPRRLKGSYMTVRAPLTRWTAVCQYDRLSPDHGVAALVGGAQVAIFRTSDGDVYAIGHRDPVSGAHVMSRGIVGTRGGAPTVTSPSQRLVYDLRTGECLDLPGVTVPTYPVRCRDGLVEVGIVHRQPNVFQQPSADRAG